MKSQKGFAPIILILIAVVFLAAIGGAYYLINLKKQYTAEVIVPPETITSPQPAASADPTANWKVYSHKDYHYTIKIPPQFTVDDRAYPHLQIFRINNTGQTIGPGLDGINIFLWDPSENCSTDLECFSILEKTYQGGKNAGSKTDFNSIVSTISGHEVKGIEAWSPIVSGGGTTVPSSLIYDYPLSLNGKFFEIKFEIYNYQAKDQALAQKELVMQILNTFKFTDSADATKEPAVSQTPAAGICPDTSGTVVEMNIFTYEDGTFSPRCQKVKPDQKLKVTNSSAKAITFSLGQYNIQLDPGKSQTVDKLFGDYLVSGDHISHLNGTNGPEIWLQ